MFSNNIIDRLFRAKFARQAKQKSKRNNRKKFLILFLVFTFLLSSCSIFSKENKEETKSDQKKPKRV